jgi:hypothetical protein
MAVDAADEADQQRKERRATVQALEAKLVKVRRAKKGYQEEEDPDSMSELIDLHIKAEQDLESKLRQARAQYQELRPPALRLSQAEKDRELTIAKLDKTKSELQQAQDTIDKATMQIDRLRQQQEQQSAKLVKLEALIAEQHAQLGPKGSGNQVKGEDDTPPAPAPIQQHPDFLQLQAKVAELEKALQDTKAAAERSEQQKRAAAALEADTRAADGSGGDQPPKKK